MIFVTLGSQKFQFNRLLKAVDELDTDEEIFAQIGYSDYKPQNYKYKEFLDREEFAAWEEKADIVITHGGTGAIIGAVKKGKKVIAVPRLAKYGEHVDDHQVQIAEAFSQKRCVLQCNDLEQLALRIEQAKAFTFQPYSAPESKIEDIILEYIDKQVKTKE